MFQFFFSDVSTTDVRIGHCSLGIFSIKLCFFFAIYCYENTTAQKNKFFFKKKKKICHSTLNMIKLMLGLMFKIYDLELGLGLNFYVTYLF